MYEKLAGSRLNASSLEAAYIYRFLQLAGAIVFGVLPFALLVCMVFLPSVENWLTALANAELEYRRGRVKVGAVLITGWVLYVFLLLKNGLRKEPREIIDRYRRLKRLRNRRAAKLVRQALDILSNGHGFLEGEKTRTEVLRAHHR